MTLLEILKENILAGNQIDEEHAYGLTEFAGKPELRETAKQINAACASHRFDTCSIINGRSGRCPEDCKWCAQSARYATECQVYGFVGKDECMKTAKICYDAGIGRFSIVTSGRWAKDETMCQISRSLKAIKNEIGINTCASLGLLRREELRQLWDAGVRRYHCNLETAPSYFSQLCSTHTMEDKLATIAIAKEIGFDICSGGIIGMGETMQQRIELALTLRKIQPVSIPINILCPIPGTPLENAPLISEDEIIDTVAIFRLIHPKVQLRFAGGRQRLSRQAQLEAMRCGINGAIVGDLLTTIGSTMEEDRKLIKEAGYDI